MIICGVVGALLQPAREFLESLCCVVDGQPGPPERSVSFSEDTRPGAPSSPAKSAKKITSGSFKEVTDMKLKDVKKEL